MQLFELPFHLPIYSRESSVWGQIFKIEILMDLHGMRTPESENHVFSIWSVCMYVLVSVINITQSKLQQKHQIWYSTFVSYTDAT